MSAHSINTITAGAILVASDLKSGRAVYRTSNGHWAEENGDARVFTDLILARQLLDQCLNETQNVVDPYLVQTDADGQPLHIREIIRTRGPSFQNHGNHENSNVDFSVYHISAFDQARAVIRKTPTDR